jgi:hypothetical protein
MVVAGTAGVGVGVGEGATVGKGVGTGVGIGVGDAPLLDKENDVIKACQVSLLCVSVVLFEVDPDGAFRI